MNRSYSPSSVICFANATFPRGGRLFRMRIGSCLFVGEGVPALPQIPITDGWEILRCAQNDRYEPICHSEPRSGEESPTFPFAGDHKGRPCNKKCVRSPYCGILTRFLFIPVVPAAGGFVRGSPRPRENCRRSRCRGRRRDSAIPALPACGAAGR